MQTLRVSALVFVLACGSDGSTGPEGAMGTQGTMGDKGDKGDKGDPGDEGIDGQLRIYGDGSAGAATVAANGVLFTGVAADGNLQFTDFTIDVGVTLTVPSGTIIRCTGTFTNNGTIAVAAGAQGGFTTVNGTTSAGGIPGVRPALPGIGLASASQGELGDATALRSGGGPGVGAGNQARLILKPLHGGGGGAAALAGTTSGGQGGGSLVILASVAIANAGTINANGNSASAFGSGGGAGGVVVLASPGTIASTTINANGGNGSPSSSVAAGGGGGAGGLVHMLAPAITAGTINVVAGTGGAAGGVGTITANPRAGGAGGGACATNGGSGGSAQTTGAGGAGSDGTTGVALETLVNPTALF